MKIELNLDKADMCFIGSYVFNFENPGPLEVDVEKLSANEKLLFITNINRQILKTDTPEKLIKEEEEKTEQVKPKELDPNIEIHMQWAKANEELDKELKSILAQSINTVKKEVVGNKNIKRIKRILELEKENKNRKSLVALFNDIIKEESEKISKQLGDDVGTYIQPGIGSEFVSEIEETEIEDIVLNPSKED